MQQGTRKDIDKNRCRCVGEREIAPAEAVNHFFAAWDIHIELSVLVRAVGRLPQVVQSDRARVARESLRKTLGCIFTTAALAKAAAVQAAPARAAIVPESTRLIVVG